MRSSCHAIATIPPHGHAAIIVPSSLPPGRLNIAGVAAKADIELPHKVVQVAPVVAAAIVGEAGAARETLQVVPQAAANAGHVWYPVGLDDVHVHCICLPDARRYCAGGAGDTEENSQGSGGG
ncbi:hypothetical protein CIB48_g3699 [Xylaria polymorpha]|nr:hypothetical protein CIB48_g3699 [Xylaria polymorpha]